MTKSLGTKLKELRLKNDMTLNEVADGIISPAYLSQLENGRRSNPSLNILNTLMIRMDEGLVKLGGDAVDRSPPDVDPRNKNL